MKKGFNLYITIWLVLLIVYNVLVFSTVALLDIGSDLEASFWIAWGTIIAAFFGQLGCASAAFNAKNEQRLFLNIPLIKTSYSALITLTVIGTIVMMIPDCSPWVAVMVCVAVTGFSVISIAKASVAASIVGKIDEQIKAQTFFIKMLTAEAELLMNQSKSEAVKTETRKVYEAARYSDPMSNQALSGVEGQIAIKVDALTKAVEADDAQAVASVANEIMILIKDRNNRCKMLK